MDSVVQRLHQALAGALARRRPDIEAAPVTVAEIYQELAPYRDVRGSVGFEMNADYEHALLRLLAGEDGLVRLEPEEVRQQLEQELSAPNPDVTLFRRYAACDVWVSAPVPGAGAAEAADEDWTPEWLEAAAREVMNEPPAHHPWAPAEAPAAAAPEPVRPQATEPQPEPIAPDAAPPETAPPPAWSEPGREDVQLEREMPAAQSGGSGGLQCPFCHGVLPLNRPVRYWPYCGVDQQLRPCARCGEVLEPGWRYCVSCGAPSPVSAA